MNNLQVKTSIEGLKSVELLLEARAESLDSTIKAIEKIMEFDLPDCIKEQQILTIVKRYSEFRLEHVDMFMKNELNEKLFLTGIIEGLK